MLEDHLPDFTGKHIGLSLSGRPEQSFLIQDAAFEMLGGRLFVVGRVSEAYEKQVWAKGRPASMAWDRFDYYIVFESAEQYRDEVQKWKSQKEADSAASNGRRFRFWSRKKK